MKEKKIKVLLLGLGRIASTLEKDKLRYHPCTHAGTLLAPRNKKKFQLCGIYDIEDNKILQFLQQWKMKKEELVTNIQEIKKTKFDLAIIATTSIAHFENAIFALESNIPNILVEKPACQNLAELKRILELKKEKKSRIWVNHERRYHPLYQYVKKSIEERKFGKLKTVKISVFTSGSKGSLLHDGTHAIDYIQWVLGKPIHYKTHSNSIEDRVISLLEYPNDIFVFLEVGGGRSYFQFEMEFQTTDARIVLSNDGSKIFVSKKSGLYEGFRSLKETKISRFPKSKQNPWINLYDEISDNIQGKSKQILGPIEDSKDILEMIETISMC